MKGKRSYLVSLISDEYEPVCEESRSFKGGEKFFPDSALPVDLQPSPKSFLFTQGPNGGACVLHSALYAIYMIPELKEAFNSKIMKDENYFYFQTYHELHQFNYKIPRSLVKEEYIRNYGYLFPSNNEIVNAIGCYALARLYMTTHFIDYAAYQPFYRIDIFFNQPVYEVGRNVIITPLEKETFEIKTSTREFRLDNDGSIIFTDNNTRLEGHYVLSLSRFFPRSVEPQPSDGSGHATTAFFDETDRVWKHFDNSLDTYFGNSGECYLKDLRDKKFNSMCRIFGIGKLIKRD